MEAPRGLTPMLTCGALVAPQSGAYQGPGHVSHGLETHEGSLERTPVRCTPGLDQLDRRRGEGRTPPCTWRCPPLMGSTAGIWQTPTMRGRRALPTRTLGLSVAVELTDSGDVSEGVPHAGGSSAGHWQPRGAIRLKRPAGRNPRRPRGAQNRWRAGGIDVPVRVRLRRYGIPSRAHPGYSAQRAAETSHAASVPRTSPVRRLAIPRVRGPGFESQLLRDRSRQVA